MNILILSGTYPPDKCGVGDYTYQLYHSLLNINKTDHIYLLSSHVLLKDGERIPLQASFKWNFLGISRILKEIRSINPDVISLQFPTASYRISVAVLFLVIRLRQLRFRIVTTLHEYSYSPKLARLRTQIIIKASYRVIVVDEQYKTDILKKNLLKSDEVLFIPIASNIERSRLSNDGIHLLRKKYISGEGVLIGYFGFIFPEKGVESLIKLAKILKQQSRSFKIIIAAELNGSNKYHQQIQEEIIVNNLSRYITVTGYLPSADIANLLKSVDVVVFPFKKGISTKNGSVLAALNQGTNVISTKSVRISVSPYKQLHLIDHYSDIEQMVDIIDNQMVYNVNEMIISWEEIGQRTMNFLINR